MLPTNLEITDWALQGDCVDEEGKVVTDELPLANYFGCDKYGGLGPFSVLYGLKDRIDTEWPSPAIIESDNGLQMTWTHPETETMSITDLERTGTDIWSGSRNPGCTLCRGERKRGFSRRLEEISRLGSRDH
ncbi:hypothetical protein C8J56DRAFT_867901 [Mycena floridula]|nr:hypothetical protein C8J56DRAFT_867901 [Mycena floridula]